MDKREETTRIVKSLNDYDKGMISDSELIRRVCYYYDVIKNDNLNESDAKFLRFLACKSGIPQYFDLLNKFNESTSLLSNVDINTFTSILYESTLHTTENTILHKYQKQVLDNFNLHRRNRYFLSATTSFGKTFLVYEIIRKMHYKNVMLIFPSIALLAENLDKVLSINAEASFSNDSEYSVHTLSEVTEEDVGEKNIFIYTPERYLSFIENNKLSLHFDFIFIDEIYKIDNEFLIDEESKENERDIAYRMATYYCTQNKSSDILLAGPYIEIGNDSSTSFLSFLRAHNITSLDYNEFEIVAKDTEQVQNKSSFDIDKDHLVFRDKSKTGKFLELIDYLVNTKKETVIVYCCSPAQTETYSKKLLDSGILNSHNPHEYLDFINHIRNKINPNWVVVKSLLNGIGIHHGCVPKYIQKEIIRLFNLGMIKVLICTTTITEGVNTSAKNLVVVHSKKGNKELKPFDAKNIKGRAGRFQHHFKGRLISLDKEFNTILETPDTNINHKNYDIQSKKEEIDLYITDKQYLSEKDRNRKIELDLISEGFPFQIFDSYKMIKRTDKVKLYNIINTLLDRGILSVSKLNKSVFSRSGVDFKELQIILKICDTIIPQDSALKNLIARKRGSEIDNTEYSNIVFLLHAYVRYGITGMINHYAEREDLANLDNKIRETSRLVFNTFKYQLVKYLGVFNMIYKTVIAQRNGELFDEVSGIENLLTILEHNAFSKNGRIASDYGVPHAVVRVIDTNPNLLTSLDSYEKQVYNDVLRIIK